MSTTELHPLAAEYLERLRVVSRLLPRSQRRDLLREIEAHFAEATDPAMSDAQVLDVIDRLGDPEEIVAAQAPDAPAPTGPGSARRLHEWLAILGLLFGGFFAGVGWLIGVVLLWTSAAWTLRDKLIGTLIVPGGYAGLLGLLLGVGTGESTQVCSSTAAPDPGSSGALAFGGAGAMHCITTGTPSAASHVLMILALVALLMLPTTTAVYLARRAVRLRPV